MSPSPFFPTTRRSLIEGLADPKSPGWDDFFRLYGPVVYRMARHGRLPAADAEEVVSIVMSNFVRRMRHEFVLLAERGRFRSYLRTATNREVARMRGRSAARDPGETPDGVDDAAQAHWVQSERRERLHACLCRLRDEEAMHARSLDAFEEYVLEERPAAEVAARHDMTLNRLYGIKHDVIRRLRVLWRQLDEEMGEV